MALLGESISAFLKNGTLDLWLQAVLLVCMLLGFCLTSWAYNKVKGPPAVSKESSSVVSKKKKGPHSGSQKSQQADPKGSSTPGDFKKAALAPEAEASSSPSVSESPARAQAPPSAAEGPMLGAPGQENLLFAFSGDVFDGNHVVNIRDPPHSFTRTLGGAMTISFQARWDALNLRSRIIDFGDGQGVDNIVISNLERGKTLLVEIYRGTAKKRLLMPTALSIGETHRYLFTVSESGTMRMLRDGSQLGIQPQGYSPRELPRQKLLLGGSNWPGDENFKGEITELKIWSGEISWEQAFGGKEGSMETGKDQTEFSDHDLVARPDSPQEKLEKSNELREDQAEFSGHDLVARPESPQEKLEESKEVSERVTKMLEKKAARKARKAAEAAEATRTAELAEVAKNVEDVEAEKVAEEAKADEAETCKEAAKITLAVEAVKPEGVAKVAKSAEATGSAQDEGKATARRRAGRAAWADMLPETASNEALSSSPRVSPKMPVQPTEQTTQLAAPPAERPADQLAGQPAEKPVVQPVDVVDADGFMIPTGKKHKPKGSQELDVVRCPDPASRGTDPGPGPAPRDIHHGPNPAPRNPDQSGGSSGSRSKPRTEDEQLLPSGQRPSSNLSPIDKELFKYEKKLREVEKLRQKQAQGEELETLQLEKLDREQHVRNKLAELQLKKALQHSTTYVDGEDGSEMPGQHAQQQAEAGKGADAPWPEASGGCARPVGRTPLRPPRSAWRPGGDPSGMAAPEGFAPFANDAPAPSNHINRPMVFQGKVEGQMMPDSNEAFQLQPVPMGSMPMAPMEMQPMELQPMEMQHMEMQMMSDVPMGCEQLQDRWECCWEWVQYGYCPRGATCRWEHPPQVLESPVDYGTGQQVYWAGGDDVAGCGHVIAMVPADYPSTA